MRSDRVARALLVSAALVAAVLGLRVVAGFLLGRTPGSPSPEEEALRSRALQLHHDALVFDGHNDVLTWIVDFDYDLGMDGDEPSDRSPAFYTAGPLTWLPFPPRGDAVYAHMDLARIREGGLDAQFFSIWPACSFIDAEDPGGSTRRAIDMIEALREQVRRHPQHIEIAYTARDVERIASAGKLAALMGLEGGHALEGSLETLRRFHELGIRYVTLTHNCSHAWADSATDTPVSGGLSEFGREVVREMNHLGVIVDVSHVSDETFWDVMEVSAAPVIASHSNARALAGSPRNLSDEMIRAVGESEGVVMINFMTVYLDPEKTSFWKLGLGWHWLCHPEGTATPLSVVVDHIDHVVSLVGINHVGIGSDFDGAPFLPAGLEDVADLPNLTAELLSRGYSDDDIRKVLGANTLRILSAAEQTAVRLRDGGDLL